MYLTLNDVLQAEEYAQDMAGAAYWCEQDGQHAIASDMRMVGREYRVRSIEGRAKLALLTRAYARLPSDGETSGSWRPLRIFASSGRNLTFQPMLDVHASAVVRCAPCCADCRR